MHQGKYIFSQLMEMISKYEFDKCVNLYNGNKGVRHFTCWQQFLCLAFGQLSYRDSLRDITICLTAQRQKIYHLGFKSPPTKSTFSDANNNRDWRIYAQFAHILMDKVHRLYANNNLSHQFDFTVFALDSSLIRLCLSSFFWAKYRTSKAAVKMHTLLDVQTAIPYFFHITDGIVSDMAILKQIQFISGAFYILDRGYNDFSELYRIHTSRAYFVIRAKNPLKFKRQYSNPKSNNIIFDQIGEFISFYSKKDYPEKIRCIKSFDPETKSIVVLLTNNFEIDAIDIAQLYKNRWQVELFFKWIKQHLKIKSFWGLSENAVKTQIYSALSTYLIVAILKKNFKLQQNLYEILQVLSVSLLNKEPINELFTKTSLQKMENLNCNQLKIW
ncbi:IS4 family transposase [Bacteroidota bacterium]